MTALEMLLAGPAPSREPMEKNIPRAAGAKYQFTRFQNGAAKPAGQYTALSEPLPDPHAGLKGSPLTEAEHIGLGYKPEEIDEFVKHEYHGAVRGLFGMDAVRSAQAYCDRNNYLYKSRRLEKAWAAVEGWVRVWQTSHGEVRVENRAWLRKVIARYRQIATE